MTHAIHINQAELNYSGVVRRHDARHLKFMFLRGSRILDPNNVFVIFVWWFGVWNLNVFDTPHSSTTDDYSAMIKSETKSLPSSSSPLSFPHVRHVARYFRLSIFNDEFNAFHVFNWWFSLRAFCAAFVETNLAQFSFHDSKLTVKFPIDLDKASKLSEHSKSDVASFSCWALKCSTQKFSFFLFFLWKASVPSRNRSSTQRVLSFAHSSLHPFGFTSKAIPER